MSYAHSVKLKVMTYIKLIDILLGPLSDLELIDSDVDGFTSSVQAWTSWKIARKLVGLNVSLAVIRAEVKRLHIGE